MDIKFMKWDPNVLGPQITKMGLACKMGLTVPRLQFVHSKSTKIDENFYSDPFQIIYLQIVYTMMNNFEDQPLFDHEKCHG
jgi:hypothetical protein